MVGGMRGVCGEHRGVPLAKAISFLLTVMSLLATNGTGRAQDWSVTELHYQGGNALRHHAVSPSGFQQILTLQHASGWKYGENFFFVDMTCCDGSAANRDIYLEWYPYLSLSAVTGRDISWGPIRDIGPLGGLNWGAQSKFVKITPGFRFQLDLPGFSFANLDYLYMVDKNQGLAAGGAPGALNWVPAPHIGCCCSPSCDLTLANYLPGNQGASLPESNSMLGSTSSVSRTPTRSSPNSCWFFAFRRSLSGLQYSPIWEGMC